MSTRKQRAETVRPAVARLVEGSSLRDASKEIGVSVGAIRNLLKGSTPQEDTLAVFESWAIGQTVPEPAGASRAAQEHGEQPLQWLADFERVVRNVGGREGALPPDERRARQRDLVNGMIDARKQRGAEVPGELYALLGRLERGDL